MEICQCEKQDHNLRTNFFGCAGFEVVDNPGFKSIEEGIDTAKDSKS